MIFPSGRGIYFSDGFIDNRDTAIVRSAAGIVKISDAGAGYGTLDAAGFKVSGVAGANFTGLPTSITVVNGIITAAS